MILIPAHNEEDSLPTVLEGVLRYAPKEEIIVVDSCSTDKTALIAEDFGAKVLGASQKGYWNALVCGYSYAIEKKADYLIQLDADGQHPPSAIPRLRYQLLHTPNTDWIIGSRKNTGSYMPLERRIVQKILSGWVLQKTRHDFGDISSGFWALNHRTLQILQNYPYQNADILIRIYGLQQGLQIMELPVPMEERKSGQSMHSRLTAGFYVLELIREWRKFNN